jgi:CheY-like chemotaxis protein
MRGDISVVSQPGTGSTFTCRVPLEESPAQPAPSLDAMTIVADTVAARRSAHADTLRALGADVVETDSLDAAVTMARQRLATTRLPHVAVVAVDPAAGDAASLAALAEAGARIVVVTRHRTAPLAGVPAPQLTQPISREQWRRALSAAAPQPASRAVAQYSGRVLLAEDNQVNRMVATGLLRKFGVVVETAADGVAAVRQASEQPFDLILMDCEMPGLNGYEATAQIRSQSAAINAPIVALTAHATSEARARCLQAGMNDFLTKPFRVEDLEAILARYLRLAELV